MAFWDNLTQKASQTTAKAVQKAKDLSEVAKLNSLITSEEGKINNTYSQIGKLYMSLHLQDYEDEFSGMVNSIIESEQKIRDYQQQIQDIKGVQKCPNCGAEVASGLAFCGSCGAPMPKDPSVASNVDLIRCESCGVMVKVGTQFCTNCGKPLRQEPKHPPAESSPYISECICPHCGAKLEDAVSFCTECGTKLR